MKNLEFPDLFEPFTAIPNINSRVKKNMFPVWSTIEGMLMGLGYEIAFDDAPDGRILYALKRRS